MAEHARLAPSGAHCWMNCAGALALQSAFDDTGSTYADEGTAAHDIGSWMLKNGIGITPGFVLMVDIVKKALADNANVQKYANAAMLGYCKDYCKLVREYAGNDQLLVEQRVNFGPWIFGEKQTDEDDAFGTADAVILGRDRLTIIDLKYGMGVKVDAFENEQLMLYALGALHSFSFLGDFTEVAMVIHQPRLEYVGEFVATVENLKEFAETARTSAIQAIGQYDMYAKIAQKTDPELWAEKMPTIKLTPGEKTCRWCIAKAECPALRQEVLTAISAATIEDFEDPTTPASNNQLGADMAKIPLIEDWCSARRALAESKLISGEEVPGWKLVEGRLGNRQWTDAEAVEAQLAKWRIKQEVIYDFSLKSPTQAEKVLPPNRWKSLQECIVRRPGKPSVAPVTDPRPAISLQATAEDFA